MQDPEDPDERAILIRLAHPDLDDAIEQGGETVVVGGEEMNPRLHFAIHEVVATQIIDGDPPQAFETAERLLALGRDQSRGPAGAREALGSSWRTPLSLLSHARVALRRRPNSSHRAGFVPARRGRRA